MLLKRSLLIFTCFLVCTQMYARIFKVATPEAFEKAIQSVKPGDEIVIVNGKYTNWSLTVNTSGTSTKPIIIRAEVPGKVIFYGNISKPLFTLTGKYTVLSGFAFLDCIQIKNEEGSGILVEMKSTLNCRVTNCSFMNTISKNQYVPMVVISGKGINNRIDHCRFNGNIDNQELQVKITKDAIPTHSIIDNNVFTNKPKVSWQNGNGGECIQVGQDPILLGTQYSYTIVRENKFVACNGEPEVISNKSSGNQYIGNEFDSCRGELVMRGGHDCRIDSNKIRSGTGGIRINGSGHTVTHNQLTDLPTGIRMMYGMAKGKTDIGFYVAASDCIIKDNIITNCKTGILIGDSKNVDWTGKFDTKRYPSRTMQDIAPFNNHLSENKITETPTPVSDNRQE
jgi:poly(beta-D-mannuronate) lyase